MIGKARRWMLRSVAAVALASSLAASVASADEWCDIDPGLSVHTPGGNVVVVHIVNSGPTGHMGELASAKIDYTAEPAAGGAATQVTVTVLIDAGKNGQSYPVGTAARSGANQSGALYAQTTGNAGTAMTLSFQLGVA